MRTASGSDSNGPTHRTQVLNVLLVRLNRYPSMRISQPPGSSNVGLLLEEFESYRKCASNNFHFNNTCFTTYQQRHPYDNRNVNNGLPIFRNQSLIVNSREQKN